MINDPLPRLDQDQEVRERLLPSCRLSYGDIWTDPLSGHRVGCLDAASSHDVMRLMGGRRSALAVNDPPYNFIACQMIDWPDYISWTERWVDACIATLDHNSSLYMWVGADQTDGFRPLPDIMLIMRERDLRPRSFITMRNQRGYGTQKNWMAVRQELLYYTRGQPEFNVDAEYTDIPKVLKGYYKNVGGQRTENLGRSKSQFIRAGNVWIDIQQVFYRLEENVSGCFAQKPIKALDRILRASSRSGDLVCDLFSHSGTTLIAGEISGRQVYTMDIDPIYCEISIRRLENFRSTGRTGWQNGNSFRKADKSQVCEGQGVLI